MSNRRAQARFKDRICLVTGASSGIGRAIALALASEGAVVALVARSASKLDLVREEIAQAGGRAECFVCDLTQFGDATQLVADVTEQLGSVRHIVNAAGLLISGRPEMIDDWDAIFAINAKAPHAIICAAADGAGEAGLSVVNLASIFALRASAGAALYSASKAALISLSRNLALDLADRKVRINCIAPGAVDTPMLSAAIEAIAGERKDEFFAAISRQYLMGRIVSPEDITRLCLFLLSDEAAAITAQTVAVDSGLTQMLSEPQFAPQTDTNISDPALSDA